MDREQKQGFFLSYEAACNIALWVMRILSVPAEMLLHIRIGERYLGISGGLALLLMWICAASAPPGQAAPLMLLTLAFAARVAIHRVACIKRRLRGGPPQHTRSAGEPLLARVLPSVPAHWITWVEPGLLVLVGMVISAINKPLGTYVVWTGAGLLGICLVRSNIAYNKLLDALDGHLEQQSLAEQVRQRQQQH
jgi:hypothetical protein